MSMTTVIFGFGRRAMSMFLILGLITVASGCASKYGKQTVDVKYYPDCYKPISEMRKEESRRAANTVAGAIVGGLAGAAIGHQQGGTEGAIIGAVGGALIGATAANLLTEEFQKKERNERLVAYSQALDQDIQGLDAAVASAKLVNACYANSYKILKAEYQAHKIGKDEMAVRLKELRDGTKDANLVLAKFASGIEENQQYYADIQRVEIQKGTSSKQLAGVTTKTKQIEQRNKDLSLELQRMNTVAATFESDYQTIHAWIPSLPPTRTLAANYGLCRLAPAAGQ